MTRTYRLRRMRLPEWIVKDYNKEGKLHNEWEGSFSPKTLKDAKREFHREHGYYRYWFSQPPKYYRNYLERKYRNKTRQTIHAIMRGEEQEFDPFVKDSGYWW